LKKILIIRFSSIGDIVLTTPVIRCIKNQLLCELHFLTKKQYKPVLINNPYIDRLHLYENGLKDVILELRKERFDYVIDLHNNIRSHIVTMLLLRKTVAFKKLNIRKWLYVRFKLNTLPDVHIVKRYLDTAKKLHIDDDHAGLDYFISSSDEVDVKSLPPAHQSGFIAFAIGAKHFTKQIPVAVAVEICKKTDFPIVLMGDKNDEIKGNIIKMEVGDKIFNACGKYHINQSASLIKQALLLITGDTGLMHIAAAFNKNIISLWGNTVPAFGMYPYMPNYPMKSTIFENKLLQCRPCSKLGYQKCPKNHFNCMNQLNINEILNAVNRNL